MNDSQMEYDFIRYFVSKIFNIKNYKKAENKNTVFGYKKGSKIISNMIFWSATLKLWVVSFAIFDLWPFYQAKTRKT